MSREEALAQLDEIDKLFADLQPCESCGRVFLAGKCCENPVFPMSEDRRRELEEDDQNFEK